MGRLGIFQWLLCLLLFMSFSHGAGARGFGANAPVVSLAVSGKTPQEALESFLQSRFPADEPGAVVLLAGRGKILFSGAFGLADLETKQRLSLSSRFYIASLTKPMTAQVVLKLIEQGKLGYETPLAAVFPEFGKRAGKVVLRHLLRHTSGLADYLEFEDFDWSQRPLGPPLLEALAKKRLRFRPGTRYEYSNSGYLVLAQVAEKVTGQSFAALLDAWVFQPAGMHHSDLLQEGKAAMGLVRGYRRDNMKWLDGHLGEAPEDLPYGDGGVLSTVEDLFLWQQALGEGRLLEPFTQKFALEPTLASKAEGEPYGMGWMVEEDDGELVLAHSGGWTGFSSLLVRYPRQEVVCVLLSNQEDLDSEEVVEGILELARHTGLLE